MKLFLGGKLFLAIATLAVSIITARLLSPENRGLYALFFTITGLVVTILHVGISPANIYFTNVKKIRVNILIGNNFIFLMGSLTLLGFFFFLLSFLNYEDPFINSENYLILIFLWLASAYTLIEVCISGFVYAKNHYSFLNKSLIIQSLLLIISALLIIPSGSNLDIAIGLRILLLLFFIIWFVKSFLSLINVKRLGFSYEVLIQQIYFGSKNWLQNIIGFLNVRSYILILGFIASPKTVGYFSIAWIFVELIRFLPDTISTMLLPELTNQDSKNQQVSFTLKLLKILFYSVLLIAVVGYFLYDYIIDIIFGDAYASASNIAKLLMFGSTAGVIYQVLTRFFTSQSQQIFSIISGSIGLAVGLISCFIFIPYFDGAGAAYAYILSSMTTAIFGLYFFLKTTKLPLKSIIGLTKQDLKIN